MAISALRVATYENSGDPDRVSKAGPGPASDSSDKAVGDGAGTVGEGRDGRISGSLWP